MPLWYAGKIGQFGLQISLGTTEMLVQPAPNVPRPKSAVTIEEVQLECVDSFKYLGSTITTDGLLTKEITSSIHKASQALCRQRVKVPQKKGIAPTTKLKI